jgi:hypothetical protein
MRALLVGGLAVTSLLGVACSDDETASGTTDAGDTTTSAAEAELLGKAVDPEACDGFAALSAAMTGDPSQAEGAIEQFESSLPEDLTEDGSTVAASFRAAVDGDESAMTSEEFSAASAAVGTTMFEGCPASARLDVTGIDYGFEGVPEQVSAGNVAVRFTNQTSNTEPHELIVLARPDGDETPLEEIATMSPDDLMGSMPMAGLVFADRQGAESTAFMQLEPGRYVAICTIPVGGGETGDPHATHGMIAEFEAL